MPNIMYCQHTDFDENPSLENSVLYWKHCSASETPNQGEFEQDTIIVFLFRTNNVRYFTNSKCGNMSPI
ncbi:hypothetical protein Trydic_g19974 [Trypoxylus dichotomus]